jgi:MFS family permease
VFYTLGVLMDPIAATTKWSRGEISFAASIFTLVLIFAIPAVGALIDRFGVRRVVVPSFALFGCGLIGIGASNTLLQFYVAFGVVAALGAGANSVGFMRAICTWFDHHRGLAIGIAQSGMGLGLVFMPVITSTLLEHGDWKFTYAALGMMVLVVGVPIVAVLVREQVKGSDPAAADTAGAPSAANSAARAPGAPSGISVAEALRSSRFWKLVGAFLLLGGAINAIALHLVPLIESGGVSRSNALVAASAFGVAMTLGRLFTGVLVDRIFAPRVAAVVFAISSAAMIVLASGGESAVIVVTAAFLVGIAAGSDGDLLSYMVSRYFGLRAFATLAAYVFSAYLIGTSLLPWIVGMLVERYGNYSGSVLLCASLGACSAVLMLLLGPYPRNLSKVS